MSELLELERKAIERIKAFEPEEGYYELQEERFSKHSSQCSLFVEPEQIKLTEV